MYWSRHIGFSHNACSVHASNDEESKNVRLLFLKSLANQRTGPKLNINIIHTRNNAKFRQRIAEVNDLRENLLLAVENV